MAAGAPTDLPLGAVALQMGDSSYQQPCRYEVDDFWDFDSVSLPSRICRQTQKGSGRFVKGSGADGFLHQIRTSERRPVPFARIDTLDTLASASLEDSRSAADAPTALPAGAESFPKSDSSYQHSDRYDEGDMWDFDSISLPSQICRENQKNPIRLVKDSGAEGCPRIRRRASGFRQHKLRTKERASQKGPKLACVPTENELVKQLADLQC
jgi:hypothetical protein